MSEKFGPCKWSLGHSRPGKNFPEQPEGCRVSGGNRTRPVVCARDRSAAPREWSTTCRNAFPWRRAARNERVRRRVARAGNVRDMDQGLQACGAQSRPGPRLYAHRGRHLCAQRAEEGGGRLGQEKLVDLPFGARGRGAGAVECGVFDGRDALAISKVQFIRNAELLGLICPGSRAADMNEPVRVRERQRLQKHRLDDAEDCGVRSDGECCTACSRTA